MAQLLGVVIGLVLIYLILSLVSTAVNELISGAFNSRARHMVKGLMMLFGATKKSDHAYALFRAHPLIKTLHKPKKDPSYIPTEVFSSVVLDLIHTASKEEVRSDASIKAGIAAIEQPDLKRALAVLFADGGGTLEGLRKQVGQWFDGAMDRVGGWYKRNTQIMLIVIGFVVCCFVNADTIRIARTLANDAPVREALVAQAKAYVERTAPPKETEADRAKRLEKEKTETAETKAARLRSEKEEELKGLHDDVEGLMAIGVPLGWVKCPSFPDLGAALIGVLISALAVSLGAPFWFDMLNRVVNIRAAGINPVEKAAEKARVAAKENAARRA